MAVDAGSPRRSRRATVVAVVAVASLTLGGIALAQVPFTDIEGNTHEDNIRQAYELGLTVGTTPTTYSPRANVRRDQMASFLINSLEHAHPQIEVEWIAEFVDFAFVMPDGTTFTDDDEVEAQLEALEDEHEDDEIPPVGAQLYATQDVWSVDEDGAPGEVVGSSHIQCVHQAEVGRFHCDVAYDLPEEGALYATTSVNFLEAEEAEEFLLDLAVTGGAGEFYGATGDLLVEDLDEDLEFVSGTVLLHGTR